MQKREIARGAEQKFGEGLPLVLYVEDNPENQHVAVFALRKKYEVRVAATAREACALLRELGASIAIILMDIELQESDMNGIELTSLIRGKMPASDLPDYARAVPVLPRTPILFVTAFGDKYPEELLRKAGGDRVIAKPVDFVELQFAMAEIHLAASKRGV